MTLRELDPNVKSALDFIEQAGFPYMKMEFEGQLNRRGRSRVTPTVSDEQLNELLRQTEECSRCRALRIQGIRCDMRSGGVCIYCLGTDMQLCSNHVMRANILYSSRSWDEAACQQFLMDNVSPTTRRYVKYIRFYYDGSVDSEVTITMPTKHAWRFYEFAVAFKKLSEEIGGGLDVRGAGLHTSVLNHHDYPSGLRSLPQNKVENFKKQMTKLLPAMFFLASSGSQSRPLNYRMPDISEQKYCAISTRGHKLFEFRLFETCYDHPERLFDNFQVIANALSFYHNPNLQFVVDYKGDFQFGGKGRHIKRFYQTPQQLKVLEAGLEVLKPAGKTMTQIKRERAFRTTEQALMLEVEESMAKLGKDYEEFVERYQECAKARMNELLTAWDGPKMNEDAFLDYLIEQGHISPKPVPKEQYVQDKLMKEKGSGPTVYINGQA